jgi:hypothetical protein
MARLVVVYWRDIPSQVIASAGRRNLAKVMLSDRFQQAIDAAAMKGGASDTDAYLEDWRKSDPVECGDDLQGAAEAEAERIEAVYDKDRLRVLISAGGAG